ncbi:hypothetical protein DPMN_012140 [Dreissena polymorpha]|uniref:Uncharacterized protein n=1 Tax=Dreissena polymorpha TaxID=45954 RepID=A0A9D4N5F3_DREPO|nr:hypothetical protein DPMN_012140 [Dreissena polymorpha]
MSMCQDEPEVPLILTTNKEKTNATWKTEYKQHYTESQANVKKQRNMENEELSRFLDVVAMSATAM